MTIQQAFVLKDVAEVIDCEHRTVPRAPEGQAYGYSIGTGNIRNGRIDLSKAKPVTRTAYEDWTRRAKPSVGDVILAREAPIGQAGLVPKSQPVCLGQRTVLIRPDERRVLDRFLHYLLLSPMIQQWFQSKATGSTVLHVNVADVRDTYLGGLPPLSEQRRIVEILDDHLSRLDAADGTLAQAEQRLGALRRSALNSVINCQDRKVVPLRRFVERIEAGRSFGGAAPPATAHEWGIIKVSAMTWGEFRPEENKAVPAIAVDTRYEIQSGDLLVSRANTSDYVGASVLVGAVRPRLLLSDKSLRLVPREGVDRHWLWLALSSPRARAQISDKATGTKDSMRNISQSRLLAVEIPDVSIAEQEADVARLVTFFDSLAALTGALRTTQRRQKCLRRSLLDAAFSGRLTGQASDIDSVEEMARV